MLYPFLSFLTFERVDFRVGYCGGGGRRGASGDEERSDDQKALSSLRPSLHVAFAVASLQP